MSVPYENPTILRALRGEPVDQTPVWIMRQAGRYLPEYRAVRAKHSFREVCTTPELATEVTMQPLRRFALDAAIIFSDILVVTEAMGVPFEIVKGTGPVMERTIRTAQDLATLRPVVPEESLGYMLDAIKMVCSEIGGRIPLLGFAGAPFTLACYLIEGGPSRDFSSARRLMYETPEVVHELLAKIADAVAALLRAEVLAGAAAVQVFETWGSILAPDTFRDFALPAIRRVMAGLADLGVPRILYLGNTGQYLDHLKDLDCEAISIDWRTHMPRAVNALGQTHSLQGNLDPCALFLPPDRLRSAVAQTLENAAGAKGHVFNLGHGILPAVDPDNLGVLVDAVHEFSAKG